MNEHLKGIRTLHEIEAWEDENERLGLPTGTIYDSKSYNKWWSLQKILRRQHNTSIATGRVNGQYLQGGNKR